MSWGGRGTVSRVWGEAVSRVGRSTVYRVGDGVAGRSSLEVVPAGSERSSSENHGIAPSVMSSTVVDSCSGFGVERA